MVAPNGRAKTADPADRHDSDFADDELEAYNAMLRGVVCIARARLGPQGARTIRQEVGQPEI